MIKSLGEKIMDGSYLSFPELQFLVSAIRQGEVNELQFVALLSAMETRNRLKGINLDETAGFVRALSFSQESSLDNLLCPAGTGGDGVKTVNISTPSSIVLASGGVRVLKNGYKSVTGLCGSRDLIKALGINPFQELSYVAESVEQIGIGYYDFANLTFLEKRSGFKSPLNLIGPLCHPFKLRYKMLGCSCQKQMNVLEILMDNLFENYLLSFNPHVDEISTVSPTNIIENIKGVKRKYVIDPKKLGINETSYEDVLSSLTPQQNASRVERVFYGEKSHLSTFIKLNAGAGFYLSGRSTSIEGGYDLASQLISSGQVINKLDEWRNFQNRS